MTSSPIRSATAQLILDVYFTGSHPFLKSVYNHLSLIVLWPGSCSRDKTVDALCWSTQSVPVIESPKMVITAVTHTADRYQEPESKLIFNNDVWEDDQFETCVPLLWLDPYINFDRLQFTECLQKQAWTEMFGHLQATVFLGSSVAPFHMFHKTIPQSNILPYSIKIIYSITTAKGRVAAYEVHIIILCHRQWQVSSIKMLSMFSIYC